MKKRGLDMKRKISWIGTLLGGFLMVSVQAQALTVGTKAPDFTCADSQGKTQKLSDYNGKYVVLEWHNQDCPFVVSQYKGKMEKLQQVWTKKGVVWFSVISSAPSAEGSVTSDQANADVKSHGAFPTATLMDPSGKVGHLFGAKTTPHMFVIDPKGVLIYNGAIDNAPREDAISDKTEEGKAYLNYVDQALTQAQAGQDVTVKTTPPYGCHVKYKD
jgi:peroxiredoxin